MFKYIGLLLLGLLLSVVVNSQEIERIHRFGVSGAYSMDSEQMYGAEISYQVYLKGIRRLEVNFGWLDATSWDIFQWISIYQWLLIQKGGFSFYTGPGAGIGYANYGYGDDQFYGVLAANVGVDYTFKIPLQLAFSYRPEWSIASEKIGNEIGNHFSFAIRLAF